MEKMIIVARVGDPDWVFVANTTEGTCGTCGHPILVTPATRAFQASEPHPLVYVCVDCVGTRMPYVDCVPLVAMVGD